jgi:tartrate dehydratase alpha subunit/fumarate hydratase class I-like protein
MCKYHHVRLAGNIGTGFRQLGLYGAAEIKIEDWLCSKAASPVASSAKSAQCADRIYDCLLAGTGRVHHTE